MSAPNSEPAFEARRWARDDRTYGVTNLGFQKLARIDPESLGKLAKHRDGRAIAASLKLADVAAIDFRPKRKLLLSPALLSSEPPEISSNGVPQIVHSRTNAAC
jgi:hypothetical protein